MDAAAESERQSSWQTLVADDATATILHDPAFMSIIAQRYRCRAIPESIVSDSGLTGVPAYQVGPNFFGQKLTSQPFNFYPHVIGAGDEFAAIASLVDRARGLGSKWYVEYKSRTKLDQDTLNNIGNIRRVSPVVDSVLELSEDMEQQKKRYRKSLRQNIRTTRRRTEEQGVTFEKAQTAEDVRNFYAVLSKLNRDKHRMPSHPIGLYLDFFNILGPTGKADYYLARYRGKIVAGTLLLKHGENWDYCWGAADEAYLGLGLNTLLVDMMIEDAVEAGARTLGFGASGPSDKELIYFKGRWGCEHVPIHYYYWNRNAKKVYPKSNISLVQAMFRLVPLSLIRCAASTYIPYLA